MDKQIWVTFRPKKAEEQGEETRLFYLDESAEIKAHLKYLKAATGKVWIVASTHDYTPVNTTVQPQQAKSKPNIVVIIIIIIAIVLILWR